MSLESYRAEAEFFTSELRTGGIDLDSARQNIDKVRNLRDGYQAALEEQETKYKVLPTLVDRMYIIGLNSFIAMAS